MTLLRIAWPYATRLDNGISYTAPANGSSANVTAKPNAMAVLVVVSAKGGADTLGFKVQASPDGIGWIDIGCATTGISATGRYILNITEPVMPYIRLSYTESGTDCTATITSYLLHDVPRTVTDGDVTPVEITTPDNYMMCGEIVALLTASTVADGTTYSDAFSPDDIEQGYLVITTADRTAGSVTFTVQDAPYDGSTYGDTSETSGSISSSTTTVVKLREVVKSGRIKISSSSFDGTVTLQLLVGRRRHKQ